MYTKKLVPVQTSDLQLGQCETPGGTYASGHIIFVISHNQLYIMCNYKHYAAIKMMIYYHYIYLGLVTG